jgi:hypothetical protein
MVDSLGSGSTPEQEKEPASHVEELKTTERHPISYEKGGLRTYGDDEDHDHEPPVCSRMRRQNRILG